MNHLNRILFFLTVAMILVACGQNDTGNTGESAKPVNDSAIAVNLLDVSRYKPLNVFAKYQGPDISSLQMIHLPITILRQFFCMTSLLLVPYSKSIWMPVSQKVIIIKKILNSNGLMSR